MGKRKRKENETIEIPLRVRIVPDGRLIPGCTQDNNTNSEKCGKLAIAFSIYSDDNTDNVCIDFFCAEHWR